jgi:hypothetical protein
MNWQVFDALGIFLGYSANLIVSRTGKSFAPNTGMVYNG